MPPRDPTAAGAAGFFTVINPDPTAATAGLVLNPVVCPVCKRAFEPPVNACDAQCPGCGYFFRLDLIHFTRGGNNANR